MRLSEAGKSGLLFITFMLSLNASAVLSTEGVHNETEMHETRSVVSLRFSQILKERSISQKYSQEIGHSFSKIL